MKGREDSWQLLGNLLFTRDLSLYCSNVRRAKGGQHSFREAHLVVCKAMLKKR